MRIGSFATIAWIVGLAAGPAFGQFVGQPAPQGPQLDKSRTQRWQAGVVIRAVGGPCAGLFGTVPVPTNWPEQQVKVVDEQISPAVRRVTYRNLNGVRQMVFTIPQLPAGQTATALVTFEITKSAVRAPEHPERFVIPKRVPARLRVHLGASQGIEVRNASIRAKARELVEGKPTAWEQVEAIYDWVRDNIKYQNGRRKGAAAALRDGAGNKEDLVSLFIALCRANKIPARTVWVPDHCYAEFYLADEKGQGRWFPCQVAGPRDFGRLSDFRPILQKGDNIKVPEERGLQRFVAEFLTGRGHRGGGTPQVEFVRKLLPAN